MKKVMSALLALFVSFTVMNAQGIPGNDNSSTTVQQQEEKEKIKAEDLPEAVKKTLEGDEYRGWLINAAYHHKSKDVYEVELKNGAETKTVKLDKDGKIVE